MKQERTTDLSSNVRPTKGRTPSAVRSSRTGVELSPRELVVLSHLAVGRSDEEIADLLEIAVPTVKKHSAKIIAKLNAASRTEAAIRSVRDGIIN